MTVAFAVFGIFADGDEHEIVVDRRRADDVVPISGAAEDVLGFLGIGVELPELLRLPLSPRASKL